MNLYHPSADLNLAYTIASYGAREVRKTPGGLESSIWTLTSLPAARRHIEFGGGIVQVTLDEDVLRAALEDGRVVQLKHVAGFDMEDKYRFVGKEGIQLFNRHRLPQVIETRGHVP